MLECILLCSWRFCLFTVCPYFWSQKAYHASLCLAFSRCRLHHVLTENQSNALRPLLAQECIKKWWNDCQQREIPVSDDFSLAKTLGDPVQVMDWQLADLPKDKWVQIEVKWTSFFVIFSKIRYEVRFPKSLYFHHSSIQNRICLLCVSDVSHLKTIVRHFKTLFYKFSSAKAQTVLVILRS